MVRPSIRASRQIMDNFVYERKTKLGFTARYEPIGIVPNKTHLIIDPSTPLEEAVVALKDDKIVLVNADAIGYVDLFDERVMIYYYYSKCALLDEYLKHYRRS
jgi:hypothetical protein